jgi:hypothetical protein
MCDVSARRVHSLGLPSSRLPILFLLADETSGGETGMSSRPDRCASLSNDGGIELVTCAEQPHF